MKKLFLTIIIASLIAMPLSAPYFVGKSQYTKCLFYITNSIDVDGSDGSINYALIKFGFNDTDVFGYPSFKQFYTVGINYLLDL